MNQPLISVIVPVYNVEAYLPQCVDSLINQTYPNLEILLVDDGAKDSSGAVCDAYARQDSRIRVIHKENGGLSTARNAGLSAAKGDCIAFVDGDDWIAPDTYEKMLAFYERDPELDIVYCVAQRYPRNGEELTFRYYPAGTVLPARELLRRMLLDEVGSQVVLGLYRRECWEGILFPEGQMYEDIATTYKALLPARKVGFLEEPFYYYRTNTASISYTPSPVKTYHIFLGFREHFQAAQRYVPEIAPVCCAKAAHFAISSYFHYCAEKPAQLEPTLADTLSFLETHKDTIRRNWQAIPGSRRLALQLYYAAPWAFRMAARVLCVTGLQKRLGLEMK